MSLAPPLHVRPARDADAPAVVRLLEGAGLDAAFEPREFVVAESAGRVVASARLRPLADGTRELASVAVAKELRGQGVGARVVQAALAPATGTVFALALAPGFFERLGFQRLPETPEALRDKADGTCASSGFAPMAWHASAEAAVVDVKRRYAQVAATREGGCCGGGEAYSDDERAAVPSGALLGLGTGNPVREARLQPGETVLDLGSGAGVDVFLAATQVGPQGRAIGVDFTPEMVERARANAEGIANAEFHLAPMERLPLPDASVDVVVSNCVVNLSVDKPAVLREAFRVLRGGGRFVVSDTLRLGSLPMAAQPSCDCMTGALSEREWRAHLAAAGFVDVEVRASGTTALVRARKG